ncbi:unnamed protein product [Rotaria magnacalcarata]|nr:unnamed protein product [Rotaria magnacalcarata]
MPKPILLGAIYVPPGQSIPQGLFDPYVNKSFYIFGDFNAEHTDWHCSNNNASGIQMKTWLDNTGCEMIYTNIPTLKKSSAVIDFGITHDAVGWKAEVIKEGTSDHYPVLIQSPLTTESAIGNKAQKFTIVHPNTESKTYLWKSEKYSEELKKLFVGKKYNHALFVVVDKNEILVDFTKGNYRLQNQSQDEHYSGRKRP